MKKIIKTKKLDPKTIDNSKFPFRAKVSCRDGYNDITNVKGVHWVDGKLMWYAVPDRSEMDCCEYWDIAEEISERYPREVPGGVTVLPANKPFLAYLEKGGEWLSEKTKGKREPSLWAYLNNNCTWRNNGNDGYSGYAQTLHYALDVSTKWARKHFPEIVEAMEYEAIKNISGELIKHKLGEDYYDLNWEKVKPLPVAVEKSFRPIPDGEASSSDRPEEEPPEVDEAFTINYGQALDSHDIPEIRKVERAIIKLAYENGFMAGEKRGKWKEYVRVKEDIESALEHLSRSCVFK